MFDAWGTAIVEFVKNHQSWAIPIVFGFALAESLAFLSLLVPGTAVLVGISAFLGASGVKFLPVWLAAGLGGSLGYAISYWLGKYAKDYTRQRIPADMLKRSEDFFNKWGALGVFAGHFFGPVRAVIPVVAGMVSMPQYLFQIANVSSAFLWAGGVLAPGMLGIEWLKRFFG